MKRQPAKDFRDLIVWQRAHQFVLCVYLYSDLFPKSELFGLISQKRRAAVSIPANIVEGFKKKNQTGESEIFQYRPRVSRRMPLLFDFSSRFQLWRCIAAHDTN